MEEISAINELISDSEKAERDKGIDKCRERMKESPGVCGCCGIYLNASPRSWGQVKYAVFTLRRVTITIGYSCSYIKNNPGFWPIEVLYDSGAPNAANPTQILPPPFYEYTV